MYKLFQQSFWYPSDKDMHLSPVSLGSTLSNSLFIFPLLITKSTSFGGLLYNPINPIFNIGFQGFWVFGFCSSWFGFCSLSLPLATSRENIKKQEMKIPTNTKNKIQRESRTRIKKPTQRSKEKTSTNPVVVVAWILRHLGLITTAFFAVTASLVWFFCLRGLGFVLCGFQGFWVFGFCSSWFLGFKVEGCEFGLLVRFFAVLLFFFLVLCLLLCLVLGVWVVRKRGKAKGSSRFVNFFFGFVNILWVSRFVNFFSLFAFLENRKPKKPTETEIQSKSIDFQLLRSVSIENFTNRKFRFRLANT